jgi:uncharacterized protein (DUF58 family)
MANPAPRILSSEHSKSSPLAGLRLGLPEVWVRFLLAIFGLTLAFAAAIFSTLARQSGEVVATAVLASLSLLLAGGVGLATVPYLARRVAVERVRRAFEYEVTRTGLVYLALTLVLLVAALNTGNNLLFVIVSAMLSAILISGVASAVVLNGLELDVRLPEHIFAGGPALARMVVRNCRRFLPAFSVSVVPPKAKKRPTQQWRWEPGVFAFPADRPPQQQWIRLPDRVLRRVNEAPDQPRIFEGPVYFPYIPAHSPGTANVQLVFASRGLYQQDTFGLATRFPFSFLTKTRRLKLPQRIVVFPPVEPTDEFFEILPLITGEFESFISGRGHDLYRIRQYAPDDSARHVDWKASAKAGSLLVREFTREDERKLRIVFDNPAPGAVSEHSYEGAVALAASLAWHFAGSGADLSFVAPGYEGAPDTYRFLTYLASVQPQAGGSVVDSLQVTDDYNLILTSRARGSIPTALWARSYFLFIQDRP